MRPSTTRCGSSGKPVSRAKASEIRGSIVTGQIEFEVQPNAELSGERLLASETMVTLPSPDALGRGRDGRSFGRPFAHEHRLKRKDFGGEHAAGDRRVSLGKHTGGVEGRGADDDKGEGRRIPLQGPAGEDQRALGEQGLGVAPVLRSDRPLIRGRPVGEHGEPDRPECVEKQASRNLSGVCDAHVEGRQSRNKPSNVSVLTLKLTSAAYERADRGGQRRRRSNIR